jgi:hypothetical protein
MALNLTALKLLQNMKAFPGHPMPNPVISATSVSPVQSQTLTES